MEASILRLTEAPATEPVTPAKPDAPPSPTTPEEDPDAPALPPAIEPRENPSPDPDHCPLPDHDDDFETCSFPSSARMLAR